MDEEEFMNFLKASLPPYIVQCFIVSGYDSARVVAQMTTNGSDNSIDQMEKFILKEYSDDPSCYHMSKTKSTYVFAPGHRIKITDFINDVKAYKVPVKRKLNSNPATNKKYRSHASSLIKSPPESESELREKPQQFDLQSISDSVRKRIYKWVQQSSTLNHLKEHQDYSVKVKLNVLNKPTVSVLCTFCSKEYKLHNKDSTTDIDTEDSKLNFMISNWTGHVKKCFNARSCKRAKQQTISKFLPSIDDKPIHMNKESSQTPVHQCLPSKTMSDNLSTPHKHATIRQFTSKDVKLHKSPCGHVTHVDTPSPSSVNINPPNDDKNKSTCEHATHVDTPSPSSVNINPPNDDKNKSPCGLVTHADTPSPSSVNINPPNDDKNTATDLTSMDETNQCFQQTSPVRVIQERL